MELLALFRTIARHKVAVAPVLVLIMLGLVYVFKVRPPTYKANAELILVSPPAAPTAAQIQASPRLAKINTNNPYLAMGDLTLVGDAVMDLVTSPTDQAVLAAEGAGSKYQVAMSSDPGFPPILDITGIGRTGADAILSAKLVTAAAAHDLITMQRADGVNSKYMIKASEFLPPTSAQNDVASKLRVLIAVLGGGVVLLFVVVSAAEAFARRRHGQPGGAPLQPVPAGPETIGRASLDSTQEFASPFLFAAARRVAQSLAEPRSVLPLSTPAVPDQTKVSAQNGADLERLLAAHQPDRSEAKPDEDERADGAGDAGPDCAADAPAAAPEAAVDPAPAAVASGAAEDADVDADMAAVLVGGGVADSAAG